MASASYGSSGSSMKCLTPTTSIRRRPVYGRRPDVIYESAARAPVARQADAPGPPEVRNRPQDPPTEQQSVCAQLAEEFGFPSEDLFKLVLKTGLLALAGATPAPEAEQAETGQAETGQAETEQVETETEQADPWDQLGISRATWYRRGKPDPDDPAVRATYGLADSEPEGTGTEAGNWH